MSRDFRRTICKLQSDTSSPATPQTLGVQPITATEHKAIEGLAAEIRNQVKLAVDAAMAAAQVTANSGKGGC